MSSVYEAEHALIPRKVAVKVLRSELSVDGAQVQRFFNEARATSAIRHPNIVEVIDVGRLPDGVPYLVMELLEGESLAERLERNGSLAVAHAVEIAFQAASALEAAHALDVVHRDLKPDNLFLVPDPRLVDHELVKVLDFGIAKLRGELAAPPFDTLVGAVLGTPPYMSPEQCRGLPEEIDERTDIYALGIILYEMVCGRPPFIAAGAGELMMLHMTEAPDPPSTICTDIPPALEDAILCALAKRREERFANMGEFKNTLAEIGIELGVIEPAKRARPVTLSGGGLRPSAPVPSFESETTLTSPKLGSTPTPTRERPITGDQPSRGVSGVVALGSAGRELVEVDREDAAEASSAQLVSPEERSSESDLTTIDLRDPPLPRVSSIEEKPQRRRPAFAAVAGAGALAAVAFVGLQLAQPVRWPDFPLETAHMPASEVRVAPPAEDHATRQALAPADPQPRTPLEAPESASEAARLPLTAAAAEPDPSRAAGRTDDPASETPIASPIATASEPSAPAAERARPASRRLRAAEGRTAAHRRRNRAASAEAKRESSAPASAQPAGPPPSAATTQAAPASAATAPLELGYLNLDSSPWSDVFLGPERLGTTPLIRVPLPPGKHLLTLRNPEIGASTSYAIEILPGKTLSRLVGWERR